MAWYHRLLNLTRGSALSSDLDRELQFHLDERTDELMAAGMDEAEARREARRQFGHRATHKERAREADIVVWLDSLAADLRYALRTLRMSPAFTLVAILSIGLGVGANTAIFSLINSVMLKALPVPHPEELVLLMREVEGPDGERSRGDPFTNPLWEAIEAHQDAVDGFAYGAASFNLAEGGEVRRVEASYVSGSYFPVLGARPSAGRLLVRDDDYRGCPAVAVVSAGFAAREFGGAPEATGRLLGLNGHPFEVVGVTEPSFFGTEVGSRIDVYVPLCTEAILAGGESGLDRRSYWFLQVMGRPRQALPLAQVNARLAAASATIATATLPPQWPVAEQERYRGATLVAEPAATGYSSLRNRYSEALAVLMVVVGVVLVIACANVAHLLLARTAQREHELALRRAIGAGRARLVRQLLTESLLLAGLGAAVGALFANWASAGIIGLLSSRDQPVWLDLRLDLRVLGFTAAVAALTGLLFGLAPAWRAAHSPPQSALQGRGRAPIRRRGRVGINSGLVVGQVALSLVLVVAAGLLLRSLQRLHQIDPGFDPDGVLLVRVDVGKLGLPQAQRTLLYQDLLARVRTVPGVAAASASQITPISGSAWNDLVEAEGFAPAEDRDRLVWFNAVSDGYFTTLGTAQLAGRDFGREDGATGAPVAIVNASMARLLFGDQNSIGRTFRVRQGRELGPPTTIVGVVQDTRYQSLQDANVAAAYLPISQAELWGSAIHYALRTAGTPMDLAPAVTALAREVNPLLSLEYTNLSEQVAASLARPRLLGMLSGFFGGLALLLATIGLYGTVAYSVARRQNEIGIRMALGARRAGVVGLILGEVGRLLVAGVGLGLVLALVATRWLASFLYQLTATDPATLALAVAALSLVSLVAGSLPAWRAARQDPMAVLREE